MWFPITVTEGNLPLAAHNYVVYLIYVLGISVLHKCTRHFPFHYFLRTRHFRFPYVLCTRHFRFGGMTFMDSSMADMKKFIEKARQSEGSFQTITKQECVLLKSLLKKAIESYKDEVLRYKKGQMNLWLS